MKPLKMDRISLLACITGLALVAACLLAHVLGNKVPGWVPMMASAIAGFELYLMVEGYFRKRMEGNS